MTCGARPFALSPGAHSQIAGGALGPLNKCYKHLHGDLRTDSPCAQRKHPVENHAHDPPIAA
jgi:hypothetical protein